MPIVPGSGNLLKAEAEALVNTVNCVGVMGKGVALQFRQAFPENFRRYQSACRAGEVQPGKMFVVPTMNLGSPKYIINFPTKRHWKGKSRIQDIRSGLEALVSEVRRLGIRSIAIPPLGCGNGGLDWADVRPLIETAFAELPDVQVILFAPEGAPRVEDVVVRTRRPAMTGARAVLLHLLDLYQIPGYRLTMLEVQKLVYFLQVAGEPLRLRFEEGKYGPYAENLHHVLQALDGHFIRGYGDRSRHPAIRLLPGALEAANAALAQSPEQRERLERVGRLIEGFESPYGMELLATVHWVASQDPRAATDRERAVELVHDWNQRKKDTLRPEHIRRAWDRLHEQGWLAPRPQAVGAAA